MLPLCSEAAWPSGGSAWGSWKSSRLMSSHLSSSLAKTPGASYKNMNNKGRAKHPPLDVGRNRRLGMGFRGRLGSVRCRVGWAYGPAARGGLRVASVLGGRLHGESKTKGAGKRVVVVVGRRWRGCPPAMSLPHMPRAPRLPPVPADARCWPRAPGSPGAKAPKAGDKLSHCLRSLLLGQGVVWRCRPQHFQATKKPLHDRVLPGRRWLHWPLLDVLQTWEKPCVLHPGVRLGQERLCWALPEALQPM